jgi:hypothetical protein
MWITDPDPGYINPNTGASRHPPMTGIEAILYAALYAYAALGLGYILRKFTDGGINLEP